MIIKQILDSPAERSKWVNTKEFLIYHHTGTQEWTISWVLDGLNKRADFASCHYAIDTNWDIYQMWTPDDILWHAWVSEWKWKKDLNKYSIWIEIIWPMKNGWFTKEQVSALRELTSELCVLYWIKEENVLRHKDIAPKRKVDPADTLWNKDFKTFEEFRKYMVTRPTMKWFYEEVFYRDYAKSSVFSDMNKAKERFWDIAFFIAIWIERLKQQK